MLHTWLLSGAVAVAFVARFGGAATDVPTALVLDERDGVFVAGNTGSRDFPVTTGREMTGTDCAFATKVTARSGAIRYSTALCTRDKIYAFAAAAGLAGELWVAGSTDGPGLPTTPDAAQPQFGGSSSEPGATGDAMLLRWSADGRSLRYASYYGGAGDERANALAADGKGGVWMGGRTTSNGRFSGFLAHFDARGRIIAKRSVFDEVTAMAPVGTGRFAVATTGANSGYGSVRVYRMTIGTDDTEPPNTLLGGLGEGALAKSGAPQIHSLRFRAVTSLADGAIVAAGSNVGCGDHPGGTDGWIVPFHPRARTAPDVHCIGGAGVDEVRGIGAGAGGTVWVTGLTDSPDFPLTAGAAAHGARAFVAQVDPKTGAVRFASLLGANTDSQRDVAGGHALAVSKHGRVFATGEATGGSFQPTSGAFRAGQPLTSTDVYVISLR